MRRRWWWMLPLIVAVVWLVRRRRGQSADGGLTSLADLADELGVDLETL